MTASGTRPASCCCPAARWPRWWPPTRRSAPPAPRCWRGTAPQTLAAAGVLATFGLLTAPDVPLDAPDLDLDQADEWAADTAARLPGGVPPVAPEVLAVRDLELVDPARWPQALELLAEPPLRAALVEPTRVLLASGRTADVPSYTAWWLRRHPVLGGRRAGRPARRRRDPLLAGLYDEAELPADAERGPGAGRPHLAGRAAGRARRGRRAAGPAGRPRPPGQPRPAAGPVGGAGRRAASRRAGPGPRGARGRGGRGRRQRTCWSSTPRTCGRWPPAGPLVLAPFDRAARLADLLDLALASEEFPARVESEPRERPVPPVVAARAARRARRPTTRMTGWWWTASRARGGTPTGAVHADGPDGLACGLAWAAGRWSARHLLAALLRDPGAGRPPAGRGRPGPRPVGYGDRPGDTGRRRPS